MAHRRVAAATASVRGASRPAATARSTPATSTANVIEAAAGGRPLPWMSNITW
jgi:hypothetical protein